MLWNKKKTSLSPEYTAKLFPAIFALVLSLVLLALFLFLPKSNYNNQRVLSLSSFPSFSLEKLLNGTFFSSVEQYLSDHFIFKDWAVSAVNNTEALIGKSQINDVFVTNDRLIENVSDGDMTIAVKNMQAIGKICDARQFSQSVNVGLIPTASEIYKDLLPAAPHVLNQSKFIGEMYQTLQEDYSLPDTTGIDIYSGLSAQKQERLFYHTDNRWTSLGAYVGYSAVMKGLGKVPTALDEFNIEHVTHDYYGNLARRTSIYPKKSDIIDFYHYAQKNPVDQMLIDDGQSIKTQDSIYVREALDGFYQQSVFLGTPKGLVHIMGSNKNGEHLLLFKDNYTNAMIQFLSLHYERITLVDLSQIQEEQLLQLPFSEYDSVLFLYQVGNFISDSSIYSNLSKLTL